MHPLRSLAGEGCAVPDTSRFTVDQLLERARGGLSRLEPWEAHTQSAAGARIIDVRTAEQIERDGHVPGALEISLNVLEWRLDPASPSRHLSAPGLAEVVIVLCNEGYCSSLAAARLQALGFRSATDVAGGFRAWQREGMPVVTP
jgi:rhodanese-related sulfurtransferase